jgi:hypothetical protein
MNNAAPAIVFLVFIALAIAMTFWHFSRSRSMLAGWADTNGFELLHSERRLFRRGPFFWTTAKGQEIFYVIVRDRGGETRRGWVRCGSFWGGLFSDKTEVRWDDAA